MKDGYLMRLFRLRLYQSIKADHFTVTELMDYDPTKKIRG